MTRAPPAIEKPGRPAEWTGRSNHRDAQGLRIGWRTGPARLGLGRLHRRMRNGRRRVWGRLWRTTKGSCFSCIKCEMGLGNAPDRALPRPRNPQMCRLRQNPRHLNRRQERRAPHSQRATMAAVTPDDGAVPVPLHVHGWTSDKRGLPRSSCPRAALRDRPPLGARALFALGLCHHPIFRRQGL